VIYLDNAATTLHKPPAVAEAVTAALGSLGNCGRDLSEAALDAGRTVYAAREKLSRLFGCPRPDHVCMTLNSTMALNIAIGGLFGPGDHVISTDWEHNSVLRPLYALETRGCELSFLPAGPDGQVDLAALEGLVRPNSRGLVCTHASNLTGEAVDLTALGRFARSHGLLFIVDASQSAGTLPIDMEAMGIDVVCFTGHKGLLGPQGTGGLCVHPGVEIAPLLSGGTGVQSFLPHQPAEYPTRLETGTLNGHGIAGLSAALDFLEQTGVERIHAWETALVRRFYRAVRELPGVRVYGRPWRYDRAPILSLELAGWDSSELSDALWTDFGVVTRPGAHCAPRLHQALQTTERGLVRFSWSWYNTEEETDAAAAAVARLAEEGAP
jgi:cysteine desulfurase family protein